MTVKLVTRAKVQILVAGSIRISNFLFFEVVHCAYRPGFPSAGPLSHHDLHLSPQRRISDCLMKSLRASDFAFWLTMFRMRLFWFSFG